MRSFKEDVERYSSNGYFTEASVTIDPERAHEILAQAEAEYLLEEVRDFWGIGDIIKTPTGIELGYRFPSAVSAREDCPSLTTSEMEDHLGDKYFPILSGYALEIRPFYHRDNQEFCLRVGRTVPYGSLFREEGPAICPDDYFNQLGEIIREYSKYQDDRNTDFQNFLTRLSNRSADCIFPDIDTPVELRRRLIQICCGDKLLEWLPLQREEEAKEEIERLLKDGRLYPSLEDCIKVAERETEQAKKCELKFTRKRFLGISL